MENIKITYQSLEKYIEDFGRVNLVRDGLKLSIYFAPNLDVYLAINGGNNSSFIIGKDNALIYDYFDKLYNDITTYNIYPFNEKEILNRAEMEERDYHKVLEDAQRFYQERRDLLKAKAKWSNLVKDGVINWSSDDYDEDVAPKFKIEKRKNAYIITFLVEKPQNPLEMGLFNYNNISVRVRMSGSRYEPFNQAFMNLYTNLKNLALEKGQQISIDEYLIRQRVLKGEDLKKILLEK